jgi:S1-C subfamily serine protease
MHRPSHGPLVLTLAVAVASDGHVVTNHAVKDASELFVELSDGAVRPGRVVGADQESDLADVPAAEEREAKRGTRSSARIRRPS